MRKPSLVRRYHPRVDKPPRTVTDQVRRAVFANDGTGNEPAVWFSTTAGALNGALPGGDPNEELERAIVVVIVRGDFVVRFARVPHGGASPHGHILLLAFDQATGERIPTYLLLYREPALKLLGQGQPLSY